MRITATLVLALCIKATCPGAVQKPPSSRDVRVFSVCDVLRDLKRLNGRVVTVRGLIGWTGRHGISALVQLGVDPYVDTCPAGTAGKQGWPPAISITSPANARLADGTVNFIAERPGVDELIATILRTKTPGEGVVATITGQIKTRRRLQIERHANGNIIGNGFGQAGACPALLLIKRVVAAEDPRTQRLIPLTSAGK